MADFFLKLSKVAFNFNRLGEIYGLFWAKWTVFKQKVDNSLIRL
jgi:hypothetical protein